MQTKKGSIDKGLKFIAYKELLQINKVNIPKEKGTKNKKQQSTKEKIQMADKTQTAQILAL